MAGFFGSLGAGLLHVVKGVGKGIQGAWRDSVGSLTLYTASKIVSGMDPDKASARRDYMPVPEPVQGEVASPQPVGNSASMTTKQKLQKTYESYKETASKDYKAARNHFVQAGRELGDAFGPAAKPLAAGVLGTLYLATAPVTAFATGMIRAVHKEVFPGALQYRTTPDAAGKTLPVKKFDLTGLVAGPIKGIYSGFRDAFSSIADPIAAAWRAPKGEGLNHAGMAAANMYNRIHIEAKGMLGMKVSEQQKIELAAANLGRVWGTVTPSSAEMNMREVLSKVDAFTEAHIQREFAAVQRANRKEELSAIEGNYKATLDQLVEGVSNAEQSETDAKAKRDKREAELSKACDDLEQFFINRYEPQKQMLERWRNNAQARGEWDRAQLYVNQEAQLVIELGIKMEAIKQAKANVNEARELYAMRTAETKNARDNARDDKVRVVEEEFERTVTPVRKAWQQAEVEHRQAQGRVEQMRRETPAIENTVDALREATKNDGATRDVLKSFSERLAAKSAANSGVTPGGRS